MLFHECSNAPLPIACDLAHVLCTRAHGSLDAAGNGWTKDIATTMPLCAFFVRFTIATGALVPTAQKS